MEKFIELVRVERIIVLKKSQAEMDLYVGVSQHTTHKLEAGRISNYNTLNKYLTKCGYELQAVKVKKREGNNELS